MQGGGAEEGLGEGEEAPPKPTAENLPTNKYEVIGTLSARFKDPTEDILYTTDEIDEHFRDEILRCGYIIYDISKYPSEISKALKTLSILTEQLDEVNRIGPKTYEHFAEVKIFILISTMMTWGLTKPLDPVGQTKSGCGVFTIFFRTIQNFLFRKWTIKKDDRIPTTGIITIAKKKS
jgi:hypothetical protein